MMSISTRGRYAPRILVLLASQQQKPSLTKYEIAEAEGMTPAYVQQLMMALRVAGLVDSHRGARGGFSLGRPPEDITVADVLRAVEGEIALAPCQATGRCERAATCPTRPVWQQAAQLLYQLFAGTTIADLAGGQTMDDLGVGIWYETR
jgi:Rrf2 family protein